MKPDGLGPSDPDFGFDIVPGTCSACGQRAAEIPVDSGGGVVWYCAVCVPRRRLPKSSYSDHVGEACPYCGRAFDEICEKLFFAARARMVGRHGGEL